MKTQPSKPHFVENAPVKSIHASGYEICFDPLETPLSSIPAALRSTYHMLLEEAQTHPKESLSKVLAFKESCQSSPEVDNLLTYLYVQNRQIAKAELLIEESFTKHPAYFFAKINYADQVLRKKQTHKLLEIFPSFELRDNCSGRTRYHVAEYRSFMALMSRYHIATRQKAKAKEYYLKAHEVDPAHMSIIALEKVLYPLSPIKNYFKRLGSIFTFKRSPRCPKKI